MSVPDAAVPRLRESGYVDADDSPASDTPNVSALKAEWVDHAVANGMARSEAEDKTKAELIDRFG